MANFSTFPENHFTGAHAVCGNFGPGVTGLLRDATRECAVTAKGAERPSVTRSSPLSGTLSKPRDSPEAAACLRRKSNMEKDLFY